MAACAPMPNCWAWIGLAELLNGILEDEYNADETLSDLAEDHINADAAEASRKG